MSAVERNKAAAFLDVVEQGLFLLRGDGFGVGVDQSAS